MMFLSWTRIVDKLEHPDRAPVWSDYTKAGLRALFEWEDNFGDEEYESIKKSNPDHHEQDFADGEKAAKISGRNANPHDEKSARWESWNAGWLRGVIFNMCVTARKEGEAAARMNVPRTHNPYIDIHAELLEDWDSSHRDRELKKMQERQDGYRGGVIDWLAGRGKEEMHNYEYCAETHRGWDDADKGGDEWIDGNWNIIRKMIMEEGEKCAIGATEKGFDADAAKCPFAGPFARMGGKFREACREGYHRTCGGDAFSGLNNDSMTPMSIDDNPHEKGTDDFRWWRLGFINAEGSKSRWDDENDCTEMPYCAYEGEEYMEWRNGWIMADGFLRERKLPPVIKDAKKRLKAEIYEFRA